MNWFSKHTDAVIVVGAIVASMLWMNTQFNDIQREINSLKTDVAIMKTVMLLKNIMPPEMAKCEREEK